MISMPHFEIGHTRQPSPTRLPGLCIAQYAYTVEFRLDDFHCRRRSLPSVLKAYATSRYYDD